MRYIQLQTGIGTNAIRANGFTFYSNSLKETSYAPPSIQQFEKYVQTKINKEKEPIYINNK